MTPSRFEEYSGMRDEVLHIASELVSVRIALQPRSQNQDPDFDPYDYDFQIDQIDYDDQGIHIRCTALYHDYPSSGFSEHCTVEEFCDPLLLINPKEYRRRLMEKQS